MTQPGGPSSGGGGYDVDITRAPQAIRDLEQARGELESIRDDAQSLAQVNPPAIDEVSRDAATSLSRTAVGGPHALLDALDDGIREIDRMVEALRSGFAAYQRGDEDARVSFGQSQS